MSWDSYCADLEQFANELAKIDDTERTATALHMSIVNFQRSWRASGKILADDVPLPLPRDKKLHPRKSSLIDAYVSFQFELGKDFEIEKIPYLSSFQVRVVATLDMNESFVELEDHWRVDSHAFPPEPAPREPHPYVHFQRGGHAQETFCSHPSFVPGCELPTVPGDIWRALMQYPGPRIPVPPYCPILAIDMIIGQHNGMIWRQLRTSSSYIKIISSAQSRLWEPFFSALSDRRIRDRWLGNIAMDD